MAIMFLIIWTILGIFMLAQLCEGFYLDDASPKAVFVICLICGPLAFTLFLFGLVKGFLILLLEHMDMEDEE